MTHSDLNFPKKSGEILINTLSDSGKVHSDEKQMLWEILLLKVRNARRLVDQERGSGFGYFKRTNQTPDT